MSDSLISGREMYVHCIYASLVIYIYIITYLYHAACTKLTDNLNLNYKAKKGEKKKQNPIKLKAYMIIFYWDTYIYIYIYFLLKKTGMYVSTCKTAKLSKSIWFSPR